MKFFASFFFMLSFATVSTAQKTQKVYAMGAWFDSGDSSVCAINKKYGFKLADGGCVGNHWKHNEAALEVLKKRNGGGWEEKYKADLFQYSTIKSDSARVVYFYYLLIPR